MLFAFVSIITANRALTFDPLENTDFSILTITKKIYRFNIVTSNNFSIPDKSNNNFFASSIN